MTESSLTYYELFEVSSTATPEEIKKAYRKFMRKNHPDVNPGSEAGELVRQATVAIRTLEDPKKREEYDLSLSGEKPEEEPEEPWSPSWGEEDSWVHDLSWGPDPTEPSTDPEDEWSEEFSTGWWDDYIAGGSHSSFTDPHPSSEPEPSFDPIQSLPPVTIPEHIKSGPVKFMSRRKDALTALAITVFAPLVAAVTHFISSGMAFATPMIALAFAAVSFFYTKTFKTRRILPHFVNGLSVVGVYSILALAFSKVADGDSGAVMFQLTFATVTGLLMGSSFWGYWEQRQLLNPKALKNNNSFGSNSEPLEESLDDLLNPLWQIPGLRVFRQENPAFSHLVVFGNRVALLKPVFLRNPGVLKMSGSSVLNRTASGLYERLLGQDYKSSVLEFSYRLPDDVEVYPLIVAFPSENLKSFVEDTTAAFVRSDDLCSLLGSTLLEGARDNVVDHELVTKILLASTEN